jgi:hypothetical protein
MSFRLHKLTCLCLAGATALLLATTSCGRVGYEPLAFGGSDAGLTPSQDSATFADTNSAATPDALVPLPQTITLPYTQDFEHPVPQWALHSTTTGGSYTRDTNRKRTGTASMKVETTATGAVTFAEVWLPTILTSGQVNMRVFMFVPSDVPIANWLVPMEFKGSLLNDAKFSIDLYAKQAFGTDLSPGNIGAVTASKFPQDSWACVELEMTLSATAGTARVFVNDTMVKEFKKVGTLLSDIDPGVKRFRLGVIPDVGQRPFAIWFDDWSVTTSHIGCQ